MSGKSLLGTIVFIGCFVIVTMVARTLILGGEPMTSLAQAPALAGAVSVGLGQADGSDTLPQAGKDYQLKSVRYFEDKKWAVASINPLNNDADPAVLVLKKIDGVYQTVLGPAGQFTNSYLYVMPSDVGLYLVKQGAFGG